MPAAPSSSAELFDLLQKSGVVTPDRLAEAVPDPAALPPEPGRAAAELVRRGVVTRFQASQLLAGRHKGFRLGPYVIHDTLGRGGMGAVYLAEHSELHRKVAIKVLVAQKDDDQKLAQERFLREARSVAALDHPNIVRIFDVARHGETPYLVMEYVDGESLQGILDRDGSVPYPAAADYVAQAASGLQHAHEKGLVHRDIKPANLMRAKDGTVKLLDLGLARSNTAERDKLTEKLDSGAVVGTADFIAPEQALNAKVDIRSDIYSLGATFFALVSGKPPFEGNTTQKLLQHQMTAAPNLTTLDASLPKGLAAVAARMLAKKPDQRFQTPADVIAALAPWLVNSGRVLAGLSATNLAAGAGIQAAIGDMARRSSRRLGKAPIAVIDDEDDKPDDGDPGPDTDPVDAAVTCRNTRPRLNPKPAEKKGNKTPIYAAGGLLLLLAGGAVAYVATSGKTDPPAVAATGPKADPPPPLARQADLPRGEPKADTPADPPAPAIPPPAASLVPVRSFDFAAVTPFRASYELRKATPIEGTPNFPDGVSGGSFSPGGSKMTTTAEVVAGVRDGHPALGLANTSSPRAGHLLFDLSALGVALDPAKEYRLTVTYQTTPGATGGLIVQNANDRFAAVATQKFPASAAWRTAELAYKPAAGSAARVAVYNYATAPTEFVYVRRLDVAEVVAGGGP